jgi:hypothetical protein
MEAGCWRESNGLGGETLRGLGAGSFAYWKVCKLGKEQRNEAGLGWEPVGRGWDSIYTGEDSHGSYDRLREMQGMGRIED